MRRTKQRAGSLKPQEKIFFDKVSELEIQSPSTSTQKAMQPINEELINKSEEGMNSLKVSF